MFFKYKNKNTGSFGSLSSLNKKRQGVWQFLPQTKIHWSDGSFECSSCIKTKTQGVLVAFLPQTKNDREFGSFFLKQKYNGPMGVLYVLQV